MGSRSSFEPNKARYFEFRSILFSRGQRLERREYCTNAKVSAHVAAAADRNNRDNQRDTAVGYHGALDRSCEAPPGKAAKGSQPPCGGAAAPTRGALQKQPFAVRRFFPVIKRLIDTADLRQSEAVVG